MENKKPTAKIELDGKTVEFYDAIHHNITSTFGWWERIKILFGIKYHMSITIYVMNEEALVTGTKTVAWVPDVFPKKENGGYEQINSDQELNDIYYGKK